MKKIITIGLMLFCSIISKAQDGLDFGIKGGLNWSYLKGKDIGNLSNGGEARELSGQMIGFTVNNKLSSGFWLKHEVFYSRRLMTIQLDDAIHPIFRSELKRGYIDLFPATPTYHYQRFQLYSGPYIEMLLNASVQRKDENGNLYTDKSFFGASDVKGNYSQKFDAGLVIGAEYEFPFGINIGARFMRGFVPLIEDSALKDQWRIYNQSLAFTIGYSFN